ncbi:MAG: hypothetical protein ACHQ15_07345 [Candidatus Limnocylindrales bacterium]
MSRSGALGSAAPPTVAGGDHAISSPEQRLRSDALLVEWLMAYPSRRPGRWAAPGFRRQVELVLHHLEPIRSVALLASSFEREGARSAWPAASLPRRHDGAALGDVDSPLEMAYVIRWIELTSGVRVEIWA